MPEKVIRVSAGRALWLALLMLLPYSAAAQDYPARPIRIIVPFTPGAGTDIVGRAIAYALNEAWKQSVVVDNRPGAGGTIAGELVAKANPDGYTLLLGNVSTLAIAPALNPRLSYDPLRDFAPITLITTSENVLVLHPSVPAASVRELISYAKANPRKLNYGSSGSGTTSHLGGAMFASMAGVEMTHVPYKGSAPMLTDLLSGQLQLAFSSVPTALPHIKSGRLRALAMAGAKRSALVPDVPTVQEAGVPGYVYDQWLAFLAPAGTPPEIVNRLNAESVKILAAQNVRDTLTQQALDAQGGPAEDVTKALTADYPRMAKIIQQVGIKPE